MSTSRGRPLQNPELGKRVRFSVMIPEKILESLERGAERRGTSVSAEILRRLLKAGAK